MNFILVYYALRLLRAIILWFLKFRLLIQRKQNSWEYNKLYHNKKLIMKALLLMLFLQFLEKLKKWACNAIYQEIKISNKYRNTKAYKIFILKRNKKNYKKGIIQLMLINNHRN